MNLDPLTFDDIAEFAAAYCEAYEFETGEFAGEAVYERAEEIFLNAHENDAAAHP